MYPACWTRIIFRQVGVDLVMATDSAAAVEGRAGITFGVELVVPWDAPEAVVDLHSDGVVDLGTIPDVIGLAGRRPGATVCRILKGRDVRSVRVLIADSRGLEQSFHDVTIIDMGDLPESSMSMNELSLLRQQWPPAIPPSYGVAAAGSGCNARGGQETVSQYPAGTVFLLQHMDQM